MEHDPCEIICNLMLQSVEGRARMGLSVWQPATIASPSKGVNGSCDLLSVT